MGTQSLSHWATKEVSHFSTVLFFFLFDIVFHRFHPQIFMWSLLYTECLCLFLNSYAEALTSSGAVFEHGDFKEVEKVT